MKVIVTGAAGKLGTYVCRALMEAGHWVKATDKICRPETSITLELADLLDRDACCSLVAATDAVVHLANYSDIGNIDSTILFNENTAMNMNVFQAAQHAGARYVIFASSIQVLGGHNTSADRFFAPALPYLPLDGDAPANPRNAYSLSKLVGEIMLRYFTLPHMNCVAIRYPWLIDPSEHNFTKRKRMRQGAENTDGVFSYLSFSDAASLVVAVLDASLPGFRIYMPAHPKNRLRKAAADVIKEHYPEVRLRCPLQEIDALIDISRIQSEIGWYPTGS
jgi:nucleoside-diphosphate-sugar epimerase